MNGKANKKKCIELKLKLFLKNGIEEEFQVEMISEFKVEIFNFEF